MKNLKFKFWCISEKRFVCDPWITGNGSVHCMNGISSSDNVTDDIVVCQWTGMIDKAGKEIYEGDIIDHQSLSNRGLLEKTNWNPLEVICLKDKNKWVWGLKEQNGQPIYNIWDGSETLVISNIFQYKK